MFDMRKCSSTLLRVGLLTIWLSRNFVLAWETCCAPCGNQLVCNGQVCGGLFQACGIVSPSGPGNCNFDWSCQTSTWRVAVFVICLVIGIGGFLICIYTSFRWISYRKLSRNNVPMNIYRVPVQQTAFVHGSPVSSAPFRSYPESYLYRAKPYSGTISYEPSAPPPCA